MLYLDGEDDRQPFDFHRRPRNRTASRLLITGAGCSTNSGIPDYRDTDGKWKRQQPVATSEPAF
jgi:NAD-dependent SIR2 family protein deacetylase